MGRRRFAALPLIDSALPGASVLTQPSADFLSEPVCIGDADVRTHVWELLAGFYPEHNAMERRREARYPLPNLIHLLPVARDNLTPCGDDVVVAGKQISERGLSFYHPGPLPYRRMIASFEIGNGHWLGFLVDLLWCRFTKYGWYESGGRFLQSVPSPLEAAR